MANATVKYKTSIPVKSNWEQEFVRKYSDEEIEEFLEADKLSSKDRRAARKWLRKVQSD